MFGSIFRLLRPVRIIKRKFITAGLFGGDRKWLILGGLVMAGSRAKNLLGFGEPEPVYIEEIEPGQRLVLAHAESTRRRKKRK